MIFNILIILILMAFIAHGKIFSQSFSQALPAGDLNNVFAEGDYKINKAAERWIENKVEKGELAELKKIFPKEKDRVISAGFIEKLMTNQNSKIMKQGIRIRDAIIINSLIVDGQDIIYKVDLEDCIFRDEVNFR